MEIKTEFDIHQKVWFMRNNKCENLPILKLIARLLGNISHIFTMIFKQKMVL